MAEVIKRNVEGVEIEITITRERWERDCDGSPGKIEEIEVEAMTDDSELKNELEEKMRIWAWENLN